MKLARTWKADLEWAIEMLGDDFQDEWGSTLRPLRVRAILRKLVRELPAVLEREAEKERVDEMFRKEGFDSIP